MVGRSFDLFFVHHTRIVDDIEMNWLSCSNSSFVRDQVEIKESITLIFNKTDVKSCSWSWVQESINFVIIKEPVGDDSIDKDIQNLWIVGISISVNSLNHLWNLCSTTNFSKCRSTNTVSVYDDLIWQSTFVLGLIFLKSIQNILCHDSSSIK